MERILHTCWLLDEWSNKRNTYLQAWMKQGWSIVLWHDGQLSSSPVDGVELRPASQLPIKEDVAECIRYEASFDNHASCADLFRYSVLHALGGAYVDLDVRPLPGVTPELFDRHTEHPVFCREWRPYNWSLEIRFIVTPRAQDPLIGALLDQAVSNTQRFISEGGYLKYGIQEDGICKRTGPRMAEPLVQRHLGSLKGVIYPFVNHSSALNCEEHFTAKYPKMLAHIEALRNR